MPSRRPAGDGAGPEPSRQPVQEAAGPRLSRRHAAGAPSARGLLLTLLGEFVRPGGGVAWTSAVIAVFARLGVEEKATRQALMRTAAAGWLRAERVGTADAVAPDGLGRGDADGRGRADLLVHRARR